MSFAGGELSPLIDGQGQLEVYPFGLRRLRNMIVLETGGVTRRPGTYYAATASGPAYLVRFEVTKSDSYVLIFTAYALKIVKDHAVVQSGGADYSLVTPFALAELPYLQTFQDEATLRIVTGSRSVYKLTRVSDASWTLTGSSTEYGPFGPTNADTNLYLTASATGIPGTAVTITATGGTPFAAGHAGSLLRLDTELEAQTIQETLEGNETGASTLIMPPNAQWKFSWIGGYNMLTVATLRVETSEDGVTWSVYEESVYPSDRTTTMNDGSGDPWVAGYVLQGSNKTNKTLLVRLSRVDTGFYLLQDITVSFTVSASSHSGIVQLDTFVSSTEMNGTILVDPGSTSATRLWALGTINAVEGYPRALTKHDGRAVLGGSKSLRLDFSRAAEPDDFTTGLEDDDAFSFSLDRPANTINWLVGAWSDALIVGTEKGVIELVPYYEGGFTPTNIPFIRRTLMVPMARIVPQMVEDVLLAVGGDTGQQLFQVFWSQERGGAVVEDITRYASHIAGTGFTGLCVQRGRRDIPWLPTNEGLVGCTYRPNAPAWFRCTFGDEVVSACTKPTAVGEELWLCVRRGTDYFIEYLDLIDLERNIEDGHYLDSGVAWNGGEAATLSSVTLANPCTLTLAAWPQDSDGTDLGVGDYVRVYGYNEMTEQIFTVKTADATARTLTLYDQSGTITIDGSAFTAYTSGGTLEWVKNTISGLGHLDGETLIALCDGQEVACTGAATITFGTDVNDFYNTIHVGVEVEWVMETLPAEFYFQTGSTAGRTRQLAGLTLSVYRSRGGSYGMGDGPAQAFVYHRGDDQTGIKPLLYTKRLFAGPAGGAVKDDLTVSVSGGGPYPFTVRSLTPHIEVH